MKKQFLVLILFFIGLQFVTSCNKYEEGPFISLRTKTARLTASWKLMDVGNDVTQFEFKEKEYVYEFQKNGAFIGVIIIDGRRSVVIGSWDWTDNKQSIKIEKSSLPFNGEYEIIKLKNNELLFKGEYSLTEGVIFKFEKE